MKYLVVKDYAKHQHYRDRNPVWIKLYVALLHDFTFLALPEAAQAQLVKIWIMAAKTDNRIPHDPKFIARAIHATGKLYIPELLASGLLAECEQDASLETEREGEEETETESPHTPRKRGAAVRQEANDFLAKVRNASRNVIGWNSRSPALALDDDDRLTLHAVLEAIGGDNSDTTTALVQHTTPTGMRIAKEFVGAYKALRRTA